MLHCLQSFRPTIRILSVIWIFLLATITTSLSLNAQTASDNSDGFEPVAGKPENLGTDDNFETQGPTLFGVLENTHWNIATRYVTHYISKGLMLDDDSIQNQVRLIFDNTFVDESWKSHFFLDNFSNIPLDSPLREIDYAIGVNWHLFDLCDDIKFGTELAYNYYTFPGPPQAPYQPVNRENEFYVQLNTQYNKLTALLWFYYELALIQSSTILNIAYETPLSDLPFCLPICDNLAKRLSFLGTLEGGYINMDRPNGDQHGSSVIPVDFYSYIQAAIYLKYDLNKCAKFQTGILYSANNGSSSNYKSQESTWTWNVIEFDVTY